MRQAYEGDSTELNKLDVILQLVQYFKYERSENSKALLNTPHQNHNTVFQSGFLLVQYDSANDREHFPIFFSV